MDRPRWGWLFLLTFAVGLLAAWRPQWPALDAPPDAPGQLRVDWLWAIALTTAWHCRDRAMPGMMAWCGFMRDLFLGGRLGANVLLFVAAGAWLGYLRRDDGQGRSRWGIRWLTGAVLTLGVGVLRPALESPDFWVAYAPRELGMIVLSALWTTALLPLIEVGMELTRTRTWRLDDAHAPTL